MTGFNELLKLPIALNRNPKVDLGDENGTENGWWGLESRRRDRCRLKR